MLVSNRLEWLRGELRGRRTLLLVDLELGEEIETGNENVAGKVDGADNVEHERIIEGDALRDLHHTQDDDQVGAIAKKLALAVPPRFKLRSCATKTFARRVVA